MTILAVDTTGPVASVALSREGRVLCEASLCVGLTHSQSMQPMIERAVEASGVKADEIDLFACVAGPGSFTGVRIGVCAVKGMAQALNKPVAALDALEVLAMGHCGFDGTICTILDARRGQVYAAAFRFEGGPRPTKIIKDTALPLEEYLALLPEGRLLFVGDGVRIHHQAIMAAEGSRCLIAPDHLANLRAGAACYLAQFVDPISCWELEPIYLRKPQAEREREGSLGRV